MRYAPANPSVTIPRLLESAVERFGDRPWVVVDDEARSFTAMQRRVEELRSALVAAGVDHGSRVGVYLGNGFEWLEIEYAVTSLGAWLVPLNTYFKTRELGHILVHAQVSHLFWGAEVLEQPTLELLERLLGEQVDGAWPAFPALRDVVVLGGDAPRGTRSWATFLDRSSAADASEVAAAVQRVAADDVAVLLYTSGTTGVPKGAMVSHRAVTTKVGTWGSRLRLTVDDVSFLGSPLFWTFGCTINAVMQLHTGARLILHPRFEPGAVLRAVARHRVTNLQAVPAQLDLLLRSPELEDHDLGSVRIVPSGGSAQAAGMAKGLLAVAPDVELVSSYGLTEGTCCNTWTRPGDPLELIATTVGKAADDNEVAVVDPDTDEPVAPGEVGELTIAGDNVMLGYLDDPEGTARALRGGRLHTGDLATMDADGYIRIVGRSSDAYKRGGMNVYPAEVEAALSEHPAVARVAVVGVPDAQKGQVGVAFVEPAGTVDEDELLAFCRERIAAYKVPSRVRFLDTLPLTPTGKVKKFELVEPDAR